VNEELQRLASLIQGMRERVSRAAEDAERRRLIVELFYRRLKELDDQMEEIQQAASDPARHQTASELDQLISSKFRLLQEGFDQLVGQNGDADDEMRGQLRRLKTAI